MVKEKTLSDSTKLMSYVEDELAGWGLNALVFPNELKECVDCLAKNSFNSWQFERLINSASDLFDRAMTERDKVITLRSEKLLFDQSMELEERSLDIENEALKERKFTNLPIFAQARNIFSVPSVAENILKLEIYNLVERNINSEVHHTKLAKEMALNLNGSGSRPTPPLAVQVERRLTLFRADAEHERVLANKEYLFLSQLLANLELENAEFDLESKRQIHDLNLKHNNKKKSESINGGVLDINHAIEMHLDVMRRDFLEAFSRLVAAIDGINVVFLTAHKFELPSTNLPDACFHASKYTRELIHWLSLATQHDQSFTVCVSVKGNLSSDDWVAFLRGDYVALSPPSLSFEPWEVVRLRGVGCQYWSEKFSGAISIFAAPPRTVAGVGGVVKNQGMFPPVSLGRVLRSDSGQPIEVAGAVSLMNLAPNGIWWTKANIPRHVLASDISDVELYLNCVGIPQGVFTRLQNVIDARP